MTENINFVHLKKWGNIGKLKIVKFYVTFYVDFSDDLNMKSDIFCILLLKFLILD